MWGISSHPNIITLIGYSDDPKCIITQVLFFLSFHFFFFFPFNSFDQIKNKQINSCIKWIYLHL